MRETIKNNSVIGKLPPQALELEEAILGGLMLDDNAYMKIVDVLKPEMFYRDNHQKVFNAICQLFKNSDPIDMLTVTSTLRKMGELEMVGGMYFLTELTDKVSSSANIEYHARIVMQKFIQRELIRVSTEAIQNAYEDSSDILELMEQTQTALFNLNNTQNNKQIRSTAQTVPDRILEYHRKSENGLTGLGSGFAEIDKITGGWQKSDLIILAARPAMGKTALSIQIAKNAAITHDSPVVVFSLEMSEIQLTDRLISSETGIYQDKLLKRELNDYDFERLNNGTKNLIKAKIFIDDTPALAIASLRSKALRLKQLHNIQLIVIDYLQLMEGGASKGDSREQVISKISRGLKTLAKELNVPVIALSQLSREVEKRNDKRPILSDLRESGSIEQDADQVIFLYRPEYYGVMVDENNESTLGRTDCIFAKNRSGVCDTAKLRFNGAYMKFTDWDGAHVDNPYNGITANTGFDDNKLPW